MAFTKTETIVRTITISDITRGPVIFAGPDIRVVFEHPNGSFDRIVPFASLPAARQTAINQALDAIRRAALADFIEVP